MTHPSGRTTQSRDFLFAGGSHSWPDPTILVGVCSSAVTADRREAVRETWASIWQAGVKVRYFVGGLPEEEEDDTVYLPVDDSYQFLPGKVMAFFRHALEHFEFDWLFKCDDDTYVDLTRLLELAEPGVDLVGSVVTSTRGSPSGGAGYLLSRRMVELLVTKGRIPEIGDEDVLIGEEAVRLGAVVRATRRLGQDTSYYPRAENDVVTAHWCGPERLRAIHTIRFGRPSKVIEARHRLWQDHFWLYEDGVFVRKNAFCAGYYHVEDDGYRLNWLDWDSEMLRPVQGDAGPWLVGYPVEGVHNLYIELSGGLGNQMFQYAHGLALSGATGADMKLLFKNCGRPFALDMFGIALDPVPAEPVQKIEYYGDYTSGEWLTLDALREVECPNVLLAGYFQNEEFFRPVAEYVRQRFRIEEIPAKLPDVSTPICVHVRRGHHPASACQSQTAPGLEGEPPMRHQL